MIYKKFQLKTLLYLLPALFIFLVFNVLPGITSLILSFFDFSGFETSLFKKFVGFDNFIKIYEDKYFWIALKNTFLLVFGAVFIQTGIALMLSIFIFFGNFKFSVLIRSIIFFPSPGSEILFSALITASLVIIMCHVVNSKYTAKLLISKAIVF